MNYDEKISLKNDTNMRLLESYKFKVVFRYLEVIKKTKHDYRFLRSR